MAKKSTAVATVASPEALAKLREAYPVEQGTNKISLPRLGFYSQDKWEGKGKAAKLVKEGGIFYTDIGTDEKDEDDKQIWEKTDIGTEFDGIILFQRKQLKFYDEATETYTSSSIYDKDDEVVVLWNERKEVGRGTPAELKQKYMYTDKFGKTKSALEDNRILYILKDEEVYQMNLRGSSMYSFMTYSRSVLPPAVITHFCSEFKEKGEISWNMMTFKKVRDITEDEAEDITTKVEEISYVVRAEKEQYTQATPKPKVEEDWRPDAVRNAEVKGKGMVLKDGHPM